MVQRSVPGNYRICPGWFVGMKPNMTSYFLKARHEAKAIALSVATTSPHEPSIKKQEKPAGDLSPDNSDSR